jgi:hypothetical protein
MPCCFSSHFVSQIIKRNPQQVVPFHCFICEALNWVKQGRTASTDYEMFMEWLKKVSHCLCTREKSPVWKRKVHCLQTWPMLCVMNCEWQKSERNKNIIGT